MDMKNVGCRKMPLMTWVECQDDGLGAPKKTSIFVEIEGPFYSTRVHKLHE